MSNPFGKVNAVDQDRLAVRRLSYAIVENGNITDYIGIIGTTGEIYAKVSFDAEDEALNDALTFDVTVTENDLDNKWTDQPLLADTTRVVISILDVDDNPPEIIIGDGKFEIEEERGTRAEVTGPEIIVKDLDKDEFRNGRWRVTVNPVSMECPVEVLPNSVSG